MNAAAPSQGLDNSPTVDLSVVVPAYNEEQRIGPSLATLLHYLRGLDLSWELLVVNDGSRDNTAQLVNQALKDVAGARLFNYQPNRGKGYAVRTGVLASQGRWVVFLDADLSTPVEEIENALKHLNAGVDMVIGSRAHPDARIEKRPALFRRFATAVFDQVKFLLVGLREISDTQCGFKGYRRTAIVPLYQRSVVNRFMFDVEIIFLAKRAGLQIVELPVRWRDVPGSTVRFWHGGYTMFRDLLRIRWSHRGFGVQ